MLQMLFGMETEYAVKAGEQMLPQLLTRAKECYLHLPGIEGAAGIFTENGMRIYGDTGNHLEVATCEVNNPVDAVRFALAGDQMVADIAAACNATVFKNNVDYTTKSTWGSHESYLYHASSDAIAPNLLPHLVSRIIYTGAGGFNPSSMGIEFAISPRAYFMLHAISSNSTSERGIYHTRDEPLADERYHRMHLICGESLQSETAGLLRIGATALVVAMIDAGYPIGGGVQLKDPVQAMRVFTGDPTCKATAESVDGRWLSARDVQYHYLNSIERHMEQDRVGLPSWTKPVLHLWRRILDRLEHAPHSVRDVLDWSIKYHLFTEHADRRGIRWSSLPVWSRILKPSRETSERGTSESERTCLFELELLIARKIAAAKKKAEQDTQNTADMDEALRQHGLSREDLLRVSALKAELFEIDARFSQLGPSGIFSALDRAGALSHHVPGVDDIHRAVTAPPPGRAALRGKWIQRLARKGVKDCAAHWSRLWDLSRKDGRVLEMSNPFAERARWRAMLPEETPGLQASRCNEEQNALLQAYRSGNLTLACDLLRRLQRFRQQMSAYRHQEIMRHTAWIQARKGFTNALGILDELYAGQESMLSVCSDYLQVLRYNCLSPRPEMESWISRGRAIIAAHPGADLGQAVVFHEYSAHYLLSRGQLEEARALFEQAYNKEVRGLNEGRILARILCGWAEANRRTGRLDLSHEQLAQAEAMQRDGGYEGDLGVNLTCQAKLASDFKTAMTLLEQAVSLLRRLGDDLVLTRALLITAKLSGNRRTRAQCRSDVLFLRKQIPSLLDCPLMAKIQTHWRQFLESPDEYGDTFWGL